MKAEWVTRSPRLESGHSHSGHIFKSVMESSSDKNYVPEFADEDSNDLSEEFEDKECSENEAKEFD